MTRLFLFAALAASALATMDSSYDNKQDYSKGNDYSGDNKMQQSGYNPQNKDVQSGYNPPNKDMQGGYNQGDDKSKDDNNKGNDYKGNDYKGNDYKGGDNGGNNGGDVNIKVNVNIKIISIYAGGNNAVQQVAPPAMNAGQTHEVIVGGDAKKLLYTPSTLQAAAGDMVKFTFMANNHTVTQSTFPKPCVKMAGGVDSGFMPNVNNTVSPPPNYMFQVLDTKPVWFYCRQKTHCGKGMVFSINPTADKSQDKFLQMAKEQNGTAATGVGSTAAPPPPPATMAPPPPSTVIAPVYSAPPAAPPPPPPPPPSAAPPPVYSAPPAASPPAAPASPAPVNAVGPPADAGGSMATGSGAMNNGACSCSCFCGVAAFPVGAGIGMYGGWSGAVPM